MWHRNSLLSCQFARRSVVPNFIVLFPTDGTLWPWTMGWNAPWLFFFFFSSKINEKKNGYGRIKWDIRGFQNSNAKNQWRVYFPNPKPLQRWAVTVESYCAHCLTDVNTDDWLDFFVMLFLMPLVNRKKTFLFLAHHCKQTCQATECWKLFLYWTWHILVTGGQRNLMCRVTEASFIRSSMTTEMRATFISCLCRGQNGPTQFVPLWLIWSLNTSDRRSPWDVRH